MTIFVFGKIKSSKNYTVIGEEGDFPSLENYLSTEKNFDPSEFSKNQLGISYFEESDIFISFEHGSPLKLRLEETTIPRKSLVITTLDDIEVVLENINDYKDDDYDIFSGEEILSEDEETIEEIKLNIKILLNALIQFIDAGYYDLQNLDRVDDWMITFQEPIFDIFIRYLQIPSSAYDIYITDEFINNPYLRKGICVILMKILSNFLIKNKIKTTKEVSKYKSWENVDLWREIKIDF